ncbi:ABC transporter ATP-binding protein [Methylobacterium sp. J-072]|uniref:ABC transporter ATP-binding protein n=1 Tax=Methylobacterium sp. J-072 TaxID=2836651 RepID=UPI001FBBFDD6|nr:ABC transporter ATP-binding protein [Methylobacterium sp. J-072]MCJ2091156.1 ABC transporter ATP-binding protein [Methylobacterium sp. J-072]
MTALLDVRDLSISFPNARPVQELSFTIEEGETLAIVGESGSGKSLTALALLRLLPRTAQMSAGRVRFAGRDLLALSEREFRKLRGRELAMIFQEPMTALNPVLPIGAQVAEVLRLHLGLSRKAAARRAVEVLDLVRIPDPARCAAAYPHQLSGGQRQRVMIAIAVAAHPSLLVADEPTTALDVTIQAQILDLLAQLRRDLSMALLLITHDLGVVAEWADRVIALYAGRKVEEARPEQLLGTPRHPYTQGLLAASPRLRAGYHYTDGPLIEIPGHIGSAAGEAGCPFAPRCGFTEPSCRTSMPPLLARDEGRLVACPVTAAREISHGHAVGL